MYEIRGALVDIDLARRLRVRGQARGGAAGLADLRAALGLVTGQPYRVDRKDGGRWVAAAGGLDHTAKAMVVDIAHTVGLAAAHAGDAAAAEHAAGIARLADPDSDIGVLDEIAATRIKTGTTTARQHAFYVLSGRTDPRGNPQDTPQRTAQITAEHGWAAHP